jgi:hypothetical protein
VVAGTVGLDGLLHLGNFLLRALDACSLELPGNPRHDGICADCEQRRRNQALGEGEAVLETQTQLTSPAPC